MNVTFCKKMLVPTGENKAISYWGIDSVLLPPNKSGDDYGALNYEFSSEISSNGFLDISLVKMEFTRRRVDNKTPQYTRANWILSISTDPETLDFTLQSGLAEGLGEEELLQYLDFKGENMPDTEFFFTSNRIEANTEFVKEVEGYMNNN